MALQMTEITTVVQTQTIADTTTDWTLPSTFAQFDPSLGTLVDVRIGITGDVDATASIANVGAAATPVELSIPVGFAVFSPDGADQGSVTVDPTTTVNLGAYDGSTDYTGSSGTIVSGITASNNAVFVDSGDLGSFVGTGTVDLTTQTVGNATETGDGNLMTTLATKAGAVVSVQYDYIATGTPSGGGVVSGSGFESVIATLPPVEQVFANSVTTAAQSFTIAIKAAGWTDSLGVTQFDPALGTLEAVDITMNGSILASVAAENTADSAITFSTTQEAVVTLGLGGTLNASVVLSAKDSMNLASYDGTTDFVGPSGHADLGMTDATGPLGTSPFFASETDPSILAAFTGTGIYDLPISSMGTSFAQGGANLVSELLLDPGADVEISYVYSPSVACFAAGTRILTESGPIAVEHLTVGMQAVTATSGASAPIIWIGYRTVDCRRHPKPLAVSPVRIRTGAFGPGLPSRDVLLSPDHAVFFSDVLIPVRLLVNRTSVVRETVDRITYYHVELDRHDLLLAEGLPVESFLDTDNRSAFANGGGATQLYPDFASLMWDGHGYAPLVVTGSPLRAARAHLAAVAKSGKASVRKTRVRKG
jgi:collagen type I alpha